MAVDTLFLCFLEDLERNDGTPEKPYYMSKNLRKILGKLEKTARRENYHMVKSPADQPKSPTKRTGKQQPRGYSGLYTVGLSARRREGTNRHSLASAFGQGEGREGGF